MKYIPAIITLLLLLMFPQKAYSEEISLSFLEFNENGENLWVSESILVADEACPNAKAALLLEALFTDGQSLNRYSYPKGTSLISINMEYGHVTVNISPEFNDFGGGSYIEQIYLSQIIKNLLDIDEIEKVTILIDGLEGNSPEGIGVTEAASWEYFYSNIER